MRKFDVLSAFETMQEYLRYESQRYKEAEVGGVLGRADIRTFTDGKPANPNMWEDWKDCADIVLLKLKTHQDTHAVSKVALNQEQAFMAMYQFLEIRYWERGQDILISEVLKDIDNNSTNREATILWHDWLNAIKVSSTFQGKFDTE